MPHNFTRPTLPYTNVSLPNDNRFQVLTRVLNSPPTDLIFDTEYNYIIDGMNQLDNDIINVVAGNIPGSSIPANASRFLTTDGNGNLSWILVGGANVSPASLPGTVLINSSITATQIANGCITSALLGPLCVTQESIAAGAVGTNQILEEAVETKNLADLCVTATQIANQTITATQIAGGTITAAQIADQTITQAEMADASIGTDQLIPQNVTVATLAQEVLNLFIPIGTIIQFAGTTGFSANFLECNGQLVSRATYATLFTNIGTRYGVGDGSTTFGLPDMRGRIAVGIGSNGSTNGLITNATAPTIALGATFGEETHLLTIAEIPSHNHTITLSSGGPGGSPSLNNFTNFAGNINTSSTGGGLPHNNVQPSIFMTFYIRAL
jgi:microcystin-dependent protein